MEDRIRLYIIERELDNTSANGPYRVSRQRLNREKGRILTRLRGRDPRWFACGRKGGGIRREYMRNYRIKKEIVNILNLLEV